MKRKLHTFNASRRLAADQREGAIHIIEEVIHEEILEFHPG